MRDLVAHARAVIPSRVDEEGPPTEETITQANLCNASALCEIPQPPQADSGRQSHNRFDLSSRRNAFYDHPHSIHLDHFDRGLRRDEFAFRYDVDHMIGKTRLAARP